MLHSVSDLVVDEECANNTIRPSELENLIIMLKKHGYQFDTVSGAIENPKPKTVAFTFDDGYIDNYLYLFPIIKKHNVKVTCFITNQGETNRRYMNPEQILEMDKSNLVEFGGHTATHTDLDSVSPEECMKAIEDNKAWIEKILNREIYSFAYPRGRHNDEVINVIKNAGYKYAVTMIKKMQNPQSDLFRIHRQIIPRGLKTWQAYLLTTRGKFRI